MTRRILTGVVALFGAAAPLGATLVGSAAAAPSMAAPMAARVAAPVLYHVPVIGKQLSGVTSLAGIGHVASTGATSTNWSGYADEDSPTNFLEVTGSWVEPTATCAKGFLGLGHQAAYAAFWVGLDGYNSSSVEQDGTDSDCTSSGTPSYYAWYEMYPAGSNDLSTTTYPVKPGDVMVGSVRYNPANAQYTLSLTDTTEKGWTFTFQVTETGLADSSAEWVAEAGAVQLHLGVPCAPPGRLRHGEFLGRLDPERDDRGPAHLQFHQRRHHHEERDGHSRGGALGPHRRRERLLGHVEGLVSQGLAWAFARPVAAGCTWPHHERYQERRKN